MFGGNFMSTEWLKTDVKRTVLFVDDDEIVLKSIEKSIADEPYEKYFANNGEDAIKILKQKKVHVIVTDIVMPGMDGLELLKVAKEEYPDIISMVISGFAQSADVMMLLQQEDVYRFVPKSWTFDEDIRKLIRQAIDTYNLQSEHEDMVAELQQFSAKTK